MAAGSTVTGGSAGAAAFFSSPAPESPAGWAQYVRTTQQQDQRTLHNGQFVPIQWQLPAFNLLARSWPFHSAIFRLGLRLPFALRLRFGGLFAFAFGLRCSRFASVLMASAKNLMPAAGLEKRFLLPDMPAETL